MAAILIVLLFTQQPLATNPVQIVVHASIEFYQAVISPAQGDVCNFSPSCSHFAQESIDKYGFVWGSFMASDRLLRCNPWAYQSFDKHYSGIRNRRMHDPVENNYIFGAIDRSDIHNTSRLVPYY